MALALSSSARNMQHLNLREVPVEQWSSFFYSFSRWANPKPLFWLFLSFCTENLSGEQDSNSDHRSRRQER